MTTDVLAMTLKHIEKSCQIYDGPQHPPAEAGFSGALEGEMRTERHDAVVTLVGEHACYVWDLDDDKPYSLTSTSYELASPLVRGQVVSILFEDGNLRSLARARDEPLSDDKEKKVSRILVDQ